MNGDTYRVGSLAQALGLTVRTLHHYDRIGLVRPSTRTGSGHRLYDRSDVERLYQVLALRQLGLGLGDIAGVLAGTDSLSVVLGAHQDRLQQQLHSLQELHRDVAALRRTVQQSPPACTKDFLELIRKVVMVDQTVEEHFTPEQLAELEQRRQQHPGEAEQTQQDWAELMAEVDAAIGSGVDPTSAEAQDLARRWEALLARFDHGDRGLRESLFAMQADNAEEIEREHGGPSAEQIAFIAAAEESAR